MGRVSALSPVRARSLATGLSTPHPRGNPLFRNAFPTRLRRRNCAPPPSRHRFARVLANGDPSAPLLPSQTAFGLPLRAGRRRRIADEAPHHAPLAQEPRQKQLSRLLLPSYYCPPGAPTACYKLSAAASASNSLKISGCWALRKRTTRAFSRSFFT